MIPYIISPHNETQGKYKLISEGLPYYHAFGQNI